MCKRAKQWAVAVALAVACLVVPAGALFAAEGGQPAPAAEGGQPAPAAEAAPQAPSAGQKALLDKFQEGVTAYQTGDNKAAKQAFGEVLAMKPDMQAAMQMAQSTDVQQFVKMLQVPELKDEANQILQLIMRAGRESKRTIPNADQLIKDFQSSDAIAYAKATIELKGHGPYAVPYIVGLLALSGRDEQVIAGRAVDLLGGLPPDAVLPLCQVLTGTDDSLVRQRVAIALGKLNDKRAVPALMQVWADPKTLASTKDAAAGAVQAIAGRAASAMPSAAEDYLNLGGAYFFEDKTLVGFIYGMSTPVWTWNAAGKDWPEKVTYEMAPAFLYYQRMATDTAMAGLAVAPDNVDLQALMAAALVRQLSLCTYYQSADMPAGQEDMADSIHADAKARAEKLGKQVPIVLSLLQTAAVSKALDLTVKAADSPASLLLDKALAGKLDAAGGQAPASGTSEALEAALKSGDKDVRYNAAIAMVKACPTGECADPKEVMDVMSAAVRAAAQRNALIIMRSYSAMNKLISVVRADGVATMEASPEEGQLSYILSLQPSVDIVFLGANVSDNIMGRMMQFLQNDVRTKSAPVYAIVDPTQPAADLTPYNDIQQVLDTDHVRASVIDPILKEKVLAQSRSSNTKEEEALVLKAVQALNGVDPRTTKYPLAVIVPGLIEAVSGYSDEVTAAVIQSMRQFGTEDCLKPLGEIVGGDKAPALKIAACEAIAAVLKRTGAKASDDLVATLKAVLASDNQDLRRAGAEALSVAGLSGEQRLDLIKSEALGK